MRDFLPVSRDLKDKTQKSLRSNDVSVLLLLHRVSTFLPQLVFAFLNERESEDMAVYMNNEPFWPTVFITETPDRQNRLQVGEYTVDVGPKRYKLKGLFNWGAGEYVVVGEVYRQLLDVPPLDEGSHLVFEMFPFFLREEEAASECV